MTCLDPSGQGMVQPALASPGLYRFLFSPGPPWAAGVTEFTQGNTEEPGNLQFSRLKESSPLVSGWGSLEVKTFHLLEKKSKDCGILSSWFLLKGAQDVGTENPAPTSCLERVPGISQKWIPQREERV